MTTYYAVQDGGVGYIQWIGEASSPEEAYENACKEIGGEPELLDDYEDFDGTITVLTKEQYDYLGGSRCDGCLQSNLDYLASIA